MVVSSIFHMSVTNIDFGGLELKKTFKWILLSICNAHCFDLRCLKMWHFRSIASRRFFFLIGTLYLYRCVTMYITTLPVPGMHMTCAPKVRGVIQRVQAVSCIYLWIYSLSSPSSTEIPRQNSSEFCSWCRVGVCPSPAPISYVETFSTVDTLWC